MANSAILSVRIVGDAVDAVRTFQETEDRALRMQRTFERASQISALALGAITAAALDVAGAASEAEQAAGAVESVFKGSSDTIKGYAQDAADAVGLSTTSYSNLAAVLGAQLTNMGLAGGELTTQTNNLIGLGADLAATFGGTTADAVAAVSSLLRGERDPIERYGVSIKQADIDARKAALGLSGLTGEAARNADMQATLAILTEQTAAAQGQFQRESDTAAGAQQRMNAEWENARAALGEALLPLFSTFATVLGDVARWIGENQALVGFLTIVIGGLAAAILVAQGAQIAWNIAMAANPIGLIVLAIAAVIGIIALLIANWEDVQRVVGEVVDNIVAWIDDMVKGIQDAVGWLGDLLGFDGKGIGIQATTTGTGAAASLTGVGAASTLTDPQTAAASAPAWALEGALAGVRGGDTYNVTVNGAIDRDGTARTIEDLLDRRSRRTGRGVAKEGSSRWR
ncbi:hypothetical protein [Microbacterium sp. KNMS]